jgi:hypothetical protein
MAAETIQALNVKEFGLSKNAVAQQATISDAPAGGVGAAAGGWDTAAHRDDAIASINAIIAAMKEFGFIA